MPTIASMDTAMRPTMIVPGLSSSEHHLIATPMDAACEPLCRGDHRHVGNVETSYSFSGYDTLLADFRVDVDAWRKRR